jgi:hypothetical protein
MRSKTSTAKSIQNRKTSKAPARRKAIPAKASESPASNKGSNASDDVSDGSDDKEGYLSRQLQTVAIEIKTVAIEIWVFFALMAIGVVSFLWTKFGEKKERTEKKTFEEDFKTYRESFATHDAFLDAFCAEEGVGDIFGGIAACKEANRTPPPL